MRGLILALCVAAAAAASAAPAAPTTSYGSCEKKGAHDDGAPPTDGDGHIDYEEFSTILLNKDAGDHERVQVTKVKRKIATHAKKDVRLGASADESKDSAH